MIPKKVTRWPPLRAVPARTLVSALVRRAACGRVRDCARWICTGASRAVHIGPPALDSGEKIIECARHHWGRRREARTSQAPPHAIGRRREFPDRGPHRTPAGAAKPSHLRGPTARQQQALRVPRLGSPPRARRRRETLTPERPHRTPAWNAHLQSGSRRLWAQFVGCRLSTYLQ